MIITSSNEKALENVFYISYFSLFNSTKNQVFQDLSSEINVIIPIFIDKLSFFK